jgi:hypothetical protein
MPLATIDQLKEYVGDIAIDKDDALLTRLIDAASSVIESYCCRSFESTVYTNEVHDGTGTDTINLKHYPIISLASVLEGGSVLSTGSTGYGSADVIVYANEGQLRRPYWTWLSYPAWYSFTYTAGYTTVPAAIVQACLELAALMLRGKEHVGISQKTSGVQTFTYISQLSQAAQRALDQFSDPSLGRG